MKHRYSVGVVAALCGLVLASIAGPASEAATGADGGGWAHAGSPPGSQAPNGATKTSIGETYSVTGIDVSSHDHSNFPIDWASVAAGGVDFAYVKATEGTPPDPYVNPFFGSDFQAAKANGLYVGAYAYARPDLGDPVGQADVLVDRSGWTPDDKTLIPMLDIEWPYGTLTRLGNCWALTPTDMVGWIRAFVTQIQARTGRLPMIYTAASWWNECTNSNTSFSGVPLNVAAYDTTAPPLPAGWSDFTMWQTAAGNTSVPGDYDKDVFNGDLTALATYGGGSTFTPAGPARILDTRTGIGTATTTPLGASRTISLPVAGANGVPAGVTAVVLNVTVVAPTASGYLTVYPDGRSRPVVSNLNFTAGRTIPNLVTVSVVNGTVDFYNGSGGTVHVLADLAGYYGTAVDGSRFTSGGPTRMLDTRNGTGTGGGTAPVLASNTLALQVTGVNGVPASGVTAVILNVTVTAPTAAGYLTVFPDGSARPTASNLNFTAGQTIPNLVTVPVIDGIVDFYNGSGGTVHVIADLAGYFSGSGSTYTPKGPARMLDTRSSTGPVGPSNTTTLAVTGAYDVPASGVTAMVLNVTVIAPTASGYLTVYPNGTSRPVASNLNFAAGQTIPNLVTVPVVNGKLDFYNGSGGTIQVVADLAGYYYGS